MSAKGGHGAKTGKSVKAPEVQLAKHTKLSSKLAELLPEGTDLTAAATGFKNLGQFVAAVHVSYNLGIAFDALKVEMVDNGLSLGQAIHLLKPDVDADEEAEEAETEAEAEVNPT